VTCWIYQVCNEFYLCDVVISIANNLIEKGNFLIALNFI